MEVDVDGDGRIRTLDASGTTRKLRVERVDDVAVAELARDFAERDAAGQGIGALSGRGEAVGEIDGAGVAVDYGVPRKRGREIFGGLVPFDEVWRTGANRATHLTTDADLVNGGTPVPAGTYTLFTVPGPDQWTGPWRSSPWWWTPMATSGCAGTGRRRTCPSGPPEACRVGYFERTTRSARVHAWSPISTLTV
ncbi:MAG: DUF2911 domain-containing protein [Longimicrobiales bacterium]